MKTFYSHYIDIIIDERGTIWYKYLD
jgi:hypothetical protein